MKISSQEDQRSWFFGGSVCLGRVFGFLYFKLLWTCWFVDSCRGVGFGVFVPFFGGISLGWGFYGSRDSHRRSRQFFYLRVLS